jgi:hypothetical protein
MTPPPSPKSPPKFILGEGGDYWVLTWISPSESPRRSYVRCSLKHPVPNARAASTPDLIPHYNRTQVNNEYTTPVRGRRKRSQRTCVHRSLLGHRRDDYSIHHRRLRRSTIKTNSQNQFSRCRRSYTARPAQWCSSCALACKAN